MSGTLSASLLVIIPTLLLTGCGDDTSGADAGDGGADAMDTGGGARGEPLPPAPAALPVLGPCPTGWRELAAVDGYSSCDPFEEGGRQECAADEAHFPGTPGCVRLGPECPGGDGFPTDLPKGGPALFVRAGATVGDGTRSAPFGTIAEATAVATDGTVIHLGTGEYVEEVALPGGVSLIGACVAETIVRAEGPPRLDRGVINPEGGGVEVRNLSIGRSPRPGLWIVGDGVSARVSDLAIAGAELVGLSVERGASLEAERLRIHDTERPAAFPVGRAVNVETGAVATIRGLDARRSIEFGVMALEGGELLLEDALIAETRAAAPEINGGPGFGVFRAGALTANRVVLEDNQQLGIGVFGEGSTATLTDAVIRRVLPWGEEGLGRLINVEEGASVRCRRCLLEEGREVGVAVEASAVTLEDTVIRDMQLNAAGQIGRGATVQQPAAELTLLRVGIYDAQETGLAAGAGRIVGEDLTVRRVLATPLGFGRALSLQNGADVELVRASFSELVEEAIIVGGEGADLVVSDLDISDVASTTSGFIGRGIVLQERATATIERARIRRVREVAISLSIGATASLRDIIVSGVLPQACSEGSCRSFPGGHGFGVYEESSLTVTRFLVEDADFCGVHIADGANLTLDDGTIQRSTIGACVQSEDQDVRALSRNVDYVDNGSNLEATELPVPETVGIGD